MSARNRLYRRINRPGSKGDGHLTSGLAPLPEAANSGRRLVDLGGFAEDDNICGKLEAYHAAK